MDSYTMTHTRIVEEIILSAYLQGEKITFISRDTKPPQRRRAALGGGPPSLGRQKKIHECLGPRVVDGALCPPAEQEDGVERAMAGGAAAL